MTMMHSYGSNSEAELKLELALRFGTLCVVPCVMCSFVRNKKQQLEFSHKRFPNDIGPLLESLHEKGFEIGIYHNRCLKS